LTSLPALRYRFDSAQGQTLRAAWISYSSYWSDERGDGPDLRRSARLVLDQPLITVANAAEVKESPAFRELMASIRRLGCKPNHLQRVESFNLAHPDSFVPVA
jgi:hypothetical protein